MPDLHGPDPRFVEELWARVEREAFGAEGVAVTRVTPRRVSLLLTAAAAVTALAMLAVSSLQTSRAIDQLNLHPAVPLPTATPDERDELALLPAPSAEPVGPRPMIGPRLVLRQPPRSASAVTGPAAGPAARADVVRPGARPPLKAPGREQRIVFSSRRSGNGEIYTMRMDGSDVQQVTRSTKQLYNRGADWSPDGEWIAHGSAGNGLVVLRPNGEDAQVIAKNSCTDRDPNWCAGDHTPSWSPDSQWLVFVRGYEETADCDAADARGYCASLWVVRRDGTGLRQLTATGREPHWSPDGQHIVFVDGSGSSNPACGYVARDCAAPLFTIRPDGTDRRALGLVGDHPRWSPDGGSILYGYEPVGAPHDLYVADADGSDVRRVTSGPGASGGGDWSHDGTFIVYHYMTDPEAASNELDIYIRRLDGKGGARRLTTSRDYDILPRFSPA